MRYVNSFQCQKNHQKVYGTKFKLLCLLDSLKFSLIWIKVDNRLYLKSLSIFFRESCAKPTDKKRPTIESKFKNKNIRSGFRDLLNC